ncbi:tetratricopeptide repeat protein [Candidatus Falkowbacteria bacterium]|jgi:tetratricopeptide (TPR) repeat protein|nr:tetratricopeptide repeat protein [Candidatus Falkowbacteria bacterium]MBT4433420.1 tetratricopeptide repeat protein [Candidatus Falkowbacteria bacterium]
MYDIIPFSIIIISLAIILFIVVRKFPALSSVDIDSLSEEKQSKLHEQIVISRIKNRFKKIVSSKKISFLTKPGIFLKNNFRLLYKKLLNLEKKYKFSKTKIKEITDKEIYKREDALTEAQTLLKDNNLDLAEKKFVEALNLDPQNIKAYEGLSEIYMKLDQDDQAIEVLNHIIKIEENNSQAYFKLGQINFNQGDIKEAREYYLKAVKFKPHYPPILLALANVCQSLEFNEEALSYLKEAVTIESGNPKYLDRLIELSIILKDKNLAETSLSKLKEINPENKKINEYKDKIENKLVT